MTDDKTPKVLVHRTSQLTGTEHIRPIPMSRQEYAECLERWQAGLLIQQAFPTLSPDDREFIMTGVTPEEWDAAFPPDSDMGD